ncbi:hypothetical protein PTSG_00593 [Salpingoeca rosetta]|uniref:TOG domain-containing protein n=1 Tax=Salpingoeca rosetta (strain ATCC 50818 / BSB-021) TaxID=946362 RepID=F2TWX2_SALR5|nr:uncharacterized protein PTSG_00593 [Salpingoeca rosetta]EGD72568.1 hypothetical protein PTSG_00593 [Salpingoeca rosetta]|eukprot:XP_004999137.1 hypothetical protein PTSG_00593 [Salpingoeca rosetta]
MVDMMNESSTPHTIVAPLLKDLEHRNWRVRASLLSLFLATLERHGVADVHVSRLVDKAMTLLSDRNEVVRDNAFDFLVEAYRHVGAPVRKALQRSKAVPQQKLARLLDTFEELRHSGTMLGDDDGSSPPSTASATTAPERPSSHSRKASATETHAHGSGSSGVASRSARGSTGSSGGGGGARSRSASTSRGSTIPKAKSRVVSWHDRNRNKDGSVSESDFEEALRDTEPISVSSDRQLEEDMAQIRAILAKDSIDWEKRRDMVVRLRGLVAGGAASRPVFLDTLKAMNDAMVTSISDLRSGIVKEACLTIAYIAQSVGNALGPFFDIYIPPLLKQAMVNIKVIQTSAQQCIRYIIRNVHYPRTFQRLAEYKVSRSVAQRRLVAEAHLLVLQSWPTAALAKHAKSIAAYLKPSLSEADSVVRSTCRQAYWVLHSNFPDVATRVFNTLDPKTQKAISSDKAKLGRTGGGGGGGSHTSSSSSIGSTGSRRTRPSAAGSHTRRKQQDAIAALRSKSQDDMKKSGSLTKPLKLDPSVVSAPTSPESRRRHIRNEEPSRGRNDVTRRRRSTLAQSASTRPVARSKSVAGTTPRSQRSGAPPSVSKPPRHRLSAIAPSPSRLPRATGPLSSSGRLSVGSPSPSVRRPGRHSTASASRTSLRGQSENLSTFGQSFAQVVEDSKSTDWAVRLQAVQDLKDLLRSRTTPSARELNRVCSFFARQLSETHNKVFIAVVDAIAELVVIYQRDLPPGWLRDVVPSLLLKFGGGVQQKIQEKVLHLLDLIRNTFPPQLQISHLFKFLIDQTQPQNSKAKLATVEYLGGVLTFAKPRDLEAVHEMSPSEYRSAMRTIIQMTNEPKSADLRRASTSVLVMVFEVHPPLFARILAALPLAEADAARQILTVHVRDWELLTEQPVRYDDSDDHDDDQDTEGRSVVEEESRSDVMMHSGSLASLAGLHARSASDDQLAGVRQRQQQLRRRNGPEEDQGQEHEVQAATEEEGEEEDDEEHFSVSMSAMQLREAQRAALARAGGAGAGDDYGDATAGSDGADETGEAGDEADSLVIAGDDAKSATTAGDVRQHLRPHGGDDGERDETATALGDARRDLKENRDARVGLNGRSLDAKSYNPSTYENTSAVNGRIGSAAHGRQHDSSDGDRAATRATADSGDIGDGDEEGRRLTYEELVEARRREYRRNRERLHQQQGSRQSLYSQGSRVSVESSDSVSGEALQHVERAIDTLKSSHEDESITKTLHWLIRVSREGRQSLWKYHFTDLLNVLLELLNDDETSVREQALRVLREMLKNQGSYFASVIPAVLPKVLECHVANNRSIMHVADEALTHLSNIAPTRTSLQLLEPFLSHVDDLSQPILLAAIRYLTKVISRGDQETVETLAPSFMPGLLKSFRHTAPEVRKAVVTALVQFCLLLTEERAKPYLQSLSSGQQKLVEVYIQRAKAAVHSSEV